MARTPKELRLAKLERKRKRDLIVIPNPRWSIHLREHNARQAAKTAKEDARLAIRESNWDKLPAAFKRGSAEHAAKIAETFRIFNEYERPDLTPDEIRERFPYSFARPAKPKSLGLTKSGKPRQRKPGGGRKPFPMPTPEDIANAKTFKEKQRLLGLRNGAIRRGAEANPVRFVPRRTHEPMSAKVSGDSSI